MPIPFILAGAGAVASAIAGAGTAIAGSAAVTTAVTAATAVGTAAVAAAPTIAAGAAVTAGAVAVGTAVESSKEKAREQGRQEGMNEAKAEFNIKIENLKQQIESNSAYKSAQERDKAAIFMCGVAIAFANTGGVITQKEKKIIESVVCGKVGMTSTVREAVNRYYNIVPRFDNKESDFNYMLKQASDSKLINMKDIVELLILLDKCSPEKSEGYRVHYLQLVHYIA